VAGDTPGYAPASGYAFPLPWYTGDIPINLWAHETHLCDLLRQRAQRTLGNIAATLEQQGLEVETDIHFGAPAECIVEIASNRPIAMIAMVTHGYRGIRRLVLGSVTEQVIHTAPVPVFVIRSTPAQAHPPEPSPMKRILVALDGTEPAHQVLTLAAAFATHTGAQVRLIRAIPPPGEVMPIVGRFPTPATSMQKLLLEMNNDAHEMLTTTAETLRKYDIPVSTHIVEGYTADVICAEEHNWNSDVIVMPTHGYQGLQRWLLDSTADHVLHTTTAPLVLIHAP
jgi:nucleotide-binding universal stress UspA family protein